MKTWLLGPYSLGFLYAAPQHHGGEPIDHNWITREASEKLLAWTHAAIHASLSTITDRIAGHADELG